MKTVLIADDHPLTLRGTKDFVESIGYLVIETCTNGIIALNSLQHQQPDIALLDVSMPGLTGLEIVAKIAEYKIDTLPILITMHHEMSVYTKAKELGVRGYIIKEHAEEEIETCLRMVLRGEYFVSKYLSEKLYIDKNTDTDSDLVKLTFVEKKILELIAEQHTSKAIAEMLFIGEKTIESHRRNIMEKLNLPKEKNVLLIWAMKNMKM
jgi:DNA-binding NarL/FixJ family response regulator